MLMNLNTYTYITVHNHVYIRYTRDSQVYERRNEAKTTATTDNPCTVIIPNQAKSYLTISDLQWLLHK